MRCAPALILLTCLIYGSTAIHALPVTLASEIAALIERDVGSNDMMKAQAPFGLEGGPRSPMKRKTKLSIPGALLGSPTSTAYQLPADSTKPVVEEVAPRQGYFPAYDNSPYPKPLPTSFLQAAFDQLTRG